MTNSVSTAQNKLQSTKMVSGTGSENFWCLNYNYPFQIQLKRIYNG
jgi:hypothetical protein